MLIHARHLWWRRSVHRDMVLDTVDGVVRTIRPRGDDTPDLQAHLIAPLLTDLQVNGGGGVMVNDEPTPAGLAAVAAAHRRLGTGTILPTVITDAFEVTEAAAMAALELWQLGHRVDDEHVPNGIGGLHIEGPHIAQERRGTHDARYIRPLDIRTVELVERVRRHGLPLMITLAPELADPQLLQRLVHSGAVVSGGHSAASAAQTRTAIALGLSCFTHLYNAMPPMSARAPGILGAALDSHIPAGIIVDGIHVSWTMVRIALRSRPAPGLAFAVSDAMASVGGPDTFSLYGQSITVRDGALVNAEGSLAGAHIDLLTSLANLVEHVELPLELALPMVDEVPRRVMGLAPNGIDAGTSVDALLLLDERFAMLDAPCELA